MRKKLTERISSSALVSSNYFYLIIVVYLHTVIWLPGKKYIQLTILNTNNLLLYSIKYSNQIRKILNL